MDTDEEPAPVDFAAFYGIDVSEEVNISYADEESLNDFSTIYSSPSSYSNQNNMNNSSSHLQRPSTDDTIITNNTNTNYNNFKKLNNNDNNINSSNFEAINYVDELLANNRAEQLILKGKLNDSN